MGLLGVPDLTGNWEYVSTATEGEFESGVVEMGGILWITLDEDQLGIHIRISGRRLWKGEKDAKDGIRKQKLAQEGYWSAEGGFVKGGSGLNFSYITDEMPTGKGMTTVDLLIIDRSNVEHHGRFFQVKGTQGTSGSFKLRKMQYNEDFMWDSGVMEKSY